MKKVVMLTLMLAGFMATAQTTKIVGDFDELKVFDRINVELIASSENKVELSGKFSDKVEIVNKNGQLKIRMELKNILDGEDVKAKLYFKKLESVDASEGALITTSTTFKQTSMEVTAKEGAQIELNLDVSKADVKAVTGGIVRLAGKATNLDASLGTGGILEAKDLKTVQTDVDIKAGGEAKVYASELVDADIKAGGNVLIFGSPKQINKKTTLGGTIEESKK